MHQYALERLCNYNCFYSGFAR